YERFRQAVRDGRVSSGPEADQPLTFDQLADRYVERYVNPRGLRTASTIQYRLKPLRAFFGAKLIKDIRTADVEDFIGDLRQPRRVNRRDGRTLSVASVNRGIALLRSVLNWAVSREYLERTPFRRGGEVLIRLFREDNKRTRRLAPDEED